MKKPLLYLFVAVVSVMGILSACEPDNNDDDDDIPVVDARLKYQGVWNCTESSTMSYTVNIAVDTVNSTQIKLFNFHNLGFEEFSFGIVSNNTITFPSQTMCLGTRTVEGTATMQSNNATIDFYYTVNDGVNLDTIQAVYTKQSS